MDTIQQQLFEKSNPRRQYTQADAEQFAQAEKALGENGFDIYGPGANQNAALTDAFFQANRSTPVTVANIYRAVDERKLEFIWLSQAQADWYRTAQQNIDLANSLPAFLAAQGQPGRLANDGDSLFTNLLLLFSEIHARRESASLQTIQNAEDRIANRPGKQLQRVPKPRRTEPMSQAAKQDDGEPFLGRNVNMSPADYKRQAEAAYASPSPTPAKAKEPVDAWETIARNYLGNGGSHARNENLKNIFDRGFSGELSWREAARQMGELKKAYSALLPTARY